MIIGGLHDLFPQLGGFGLAINPFAIGAQIGTGIQHGLCRHGFMHQLPIGIGLNCVHECIGDADRQIEVAQVARILGMNKGFDIGMVTAQHAHLRTPARTGGLNRFTGAVKHAHVGHGATGTAVGALYQRILWANVREVVTHTATATHGFGGLLQRVVNARLAIADTANRIAHRLHKTVDQGRLQRCTGSRVDTPTGNKTVLQRP